MQRDDFQKTWGFPSEVLETVEGASVYEVHPAFKRGGEHATYKTGRPKYVAEFATLGGIILERRNAMRLISKNGQEYDVCLRAPGLRLSTTE